MARVLVRVELHKTNGVQPGSAVYDGLHDLMAAKGFARQVRWGATSYHLPTAEYLADNDAYTAEQMISRAEAAAKATGFDYSIVGAEVGALLQRNLKVA